MSNEESIQLTPAGVTGSQLKSARESKGLAIADIANAQHLRVSVIQAIESGQYEQIGSELFLKGYVRAYAGQVGLDPESIIAQLDQELEPLREQKAKAQQENPLITIEQSKRRKRQIAKIVMFLLVIGVAGFIGYRMILPSLGTDGNDAVDMESEQAPSLSDQSNESESTSAVELSVTGEEGGAVSSEPADEEEPALTAGEGGAEPTVDQSENAATMSDDQQVESEAGNVVVPLAEEAGEPELQADNESVPAAEPAAVESRSQSAVTGARLEASFKADCWVLVTDGRGQRLVSSLRRAGGSLDVSGEPPLKVVIGAVDAIDSLRFNGRALNLSSYRIVNNRAEFTLR